MATVRVTSELVESDGSEREEFYTEAVTLDLVVTTLLDNERKVAQEDWLALVAYNSGFYFDPKGFSFSITDNGSREAIVYRYTFTA